MILENLKFGDFFCVFYNFEIYKSVWYFDIIMVVYGGLCMFFVVNVGKVV